MAAPESSAAWHELLSAFADFDGIFLDGPRAVRERPRRRRATDGCWPLGQSLDMTLFADPVAPWFADLTTPFQQDRRLWRRQHRLLLRLRGDRPAAHLPGQRDTQRQRHVLTLTVYNEPEPGAWPNKTVGLLYDQDMPLTAGRFSCVLGPVRPPATTARSSNCPTTRTAF